MRAGVPVLLRAFAALLVLGAVLWPATDAYRSGIEEWRKQRVAALTADGGWLTVTGLFWLHEGANSFGPASCGSTPCDIVLPADPALREGAFYLHNGKVTLRQAGQTRELHPDATAKPDVVTMGGLTMFVIRRGDKVGIRLKDNNSRLRKEFTGLHYFPVNPDYRVATRLVPDAKQIPILNILGQVENTPSPGYVEFDLRGQKLRLTPVQEAPGELFFIFRDLTSGKETYGSGRFLTTEFGKDGAVVLDFNKAYNPPCAFTPFATCPLPPKENRLALRIEAGELKYGSH
ncbi:MAG TPA: DUF1684 domain-containing protein [Bryobacteraceae bacterium]|jgi:uncharacterized protein (DUF1684 family)|nr:DUF1684 domain-containing protein [Bryobacteraceae bacterium]